MHGETSLSLSLSLFLLGILERYIVVSECSMLSYPSLMSLINLVAVCRFGREFARLLIADIIVFCQGH